MIKKQLAIFLLATVYFLPVSAQKTDTTKVNKINFPALNLRNMQVKRTAFPYHSFIVPALAISYGFTTLKSDGLKDFNEEIMEEIWSEKPHKLLHIDNFLQFAPAAAVYGLNIAGIKGKHNMADRSIMYLMSNAFLNVTVSSLKNITRQQRPDGSDYLSFPSGHTAEAFASAEFLRQEYKDISVWYAVAGYATATATAALRMYNNKHWLSDVVAGAGIGIASTKLAYWLYPTIKRKFYRNRNMNTMLVPTYQNKQAGLLMTYNIL